MDVLIHADGFRLTGSLKGTVENKIGSLDQFEPRALRARVHLRRASAHASPKSFQATVLIEVPGADLSAEEHASQPLEAVDLLVEKIEQRLRKRKTERLAKRTKGVKLTEKALAAS
jgi:ribosomal subunit interface protein